MLKKVKEERSTFLVDEPFIKYLFENLQGDGKTFFQSLINCNENLEVLAKLIPILMKDATSYCKGCLSPLIVERTLDISSKFDKKRTLEQLRQQLKELTKAIDMEKDQYETNIAFKKKEIDFKGKCEQSQIFYENKTSEYYKQIKQLENLLVDIGFNEELKEESINALTEDNNRLKDQIKEVNDKLTAYNFQPDEESLKKAIEEMRNEIDLMNEDFEKVMEGM